MQRTKISPLERYIKKYNGKLPTETDPDYLEIVNMSKYRILPVPDVGPNAKCANCGATRADGRSYVDFGLDVEWYGPVYLCSTCIRDLSEELGLFVDFKKELDILKKELEIIPSLKDGEELYERLVVTLKEFEEFYVGLQTSSPDSGDSSSSSSGSDILPDTISNTTTPTGTRINNTKSRSSKSSTSSGRDDIRGLTELLESKANSDISSED